MKLTNWQKNQLRNLGVKDIDLKKGDEKQLIAKFKYKGKEQKVKFGDPKMPEYPGTKRGDDYCNRSYGLGKYHDVLKDPRSANTWSRIVLWDCKGKKSKR